MKKHLKKLGDWLHQKKVNDYKNMINYTDPYVSSHKDIFDKYREDDDEMASLFDETLRTGVDSRGTNG